MSNPNNCGNCLYSQNPEGGWCYVFKKEPAGTCVQYTGRRGAARRLAFDRSSAAFVIAAAMRASGQPWDRLTAPALEERKPRTIHGPQKVGKRGKLKKW